MPTVFTIGHSNQKAAAFTGLLAQYDIECVVDVRSKPYSRYRHFGREHLEKRLTDLDIEYLHWGDELGGHPEGDELYDENRKVVYERVAALRSFRRKIKEVAEKSECVRLALMCTEKDPVKCHRHPLLATELIKRGVTVIHIMIDGSSRSAEEMTEEASLQIPLFAVGILNCCRLRYRQP